MTWEWTSREATKDEYSTPPSVQEGQESLTLSSSLEEAESERVQEIEKPNHDADKEEMAVTDSTTTFISVSGDFRDAESVYFQAIEELSRVSERTSQNESLTTSMFVSATVFTTSEANILETDSVASSSTTEDSTIITTPDIITLASDTTAPTTTAKTDNTPANPFHTTSTSPNTTTGETVANSHTSTTPTTIIGTPNAATTVPTATPTPAAPRMNTLDTNQRKIKPGRCEVTASSKCKQNRIKKSVLHPSQEQNTTSKENKNFPTPMAPMNNLRGYREDDEETKVEKSSSHPPDQEQTIVEQNSMNLATSTTQEGHLSGYKEEEEKGYQERNEDEEEEHIAKAHGEEESLNTDQQENNKKKELETIVRQMRSVLVGSHRKAHTSKRSKAFEHSDSQMHFDIFNDLWERQKKGRGRQSSGKLLLHTFGFLPGMPDNRNCEFKQ